MVPDADLYLDRIAYERYLTGSTCKRCGASSCKQLVELLRARRCEPAHLDLSGPRRGALEAALDAEGIVPAVPSLQHPRPVQPGLVDLNGPGPGDPVLVTGNNELTQQVLLAVLSTTTSPFWVLFTDTRGDTLDMAVILESFTPERVRAACDAEKLAERAGPGALTLPGLTAGMADSIAAATDWPVQVGPVCAAELPLYFENHWKS